MKIQSTREMFLFRSWIGAAAFLFLMMSYPDAQVVQFRVCLDGSQGGVATAGTGTATVALDTISGAVSVSGSYDNLGSVQTAVHIHGPAPIGQDAGIIVTLTGTGGVAGTFSGAVVLSQQGIQGMLNGLHYLNVHSQSFQGGEIRGQIVQLENVDCPAELGSDPGLVDTGGDASFGPKIGHAAETFNLELDCSGAGAPGVYSIVLRLGKSSTAVPSFIGSLWGTGPKVLKCKGLHNQGSVLCFPAPGVVLPADVSLVGLSYTAQGFCQDPANRIGRTSNAIVQVIGI